MRKQQRAAGSGKLSPGGSAGGGNGRSQAPSNSYNGAARSAGAPSNGTNGVPHNGTIPKTHLNAAELDRFRSMLLAKRSELLGDVTHMEDEALRRTRSDASGDLSMMPIHMADIGTDNYEQEFTIGLIANERDVLKAIDAALSRIEQGTYGVCLATHKPIAKTRLQIKPWASYCVEYERTQESNGRRSL